MHHIYHTEGIILSSKNLKEASKYYKIFTKELGMITASAEGVRKISSKLRFILQDFSYLKIDFIKGKNFWKITSASKTNLLEKVIKNPERLKILSNISKLLTKLLTGEEANEILFEDLLKGFSVLEDTEDSEEMKNIEAVLVIRILNHLGYVGYLKSINHLVHSPFEKSLLIDVSKNRKIILKEINGALKETQLF